MKEGAPSQGRAMKFYLTHLSCACALGRTNDEVWASYAAGESGLREIEGDIPARKIFFGLVPGELPSIDEPEFDMRTNRLLRLAVENFKGELDAFLARYAASRIVIVLGASNTGIDEAERNVDQWLETGSKPETMHLSQIELGTPADYLKKLIGTKGPAYVVSTACSSSAKAFASARRLIEVGLADAAIVGGVDGRCRFAMNGFHALGALAQGRCRPLAPDRDGINLGEGVALFTLEKSPSPFSTSHFPFSIQLAGCGESSDAYHATAPDPEGRGAEAAMRAALAEAALSPSDISYVNLHGTGTPANDAMESAALARVFSLGDSPLVQGARSRADGDSPLVVESTKALTGHCLGAAGAVEAALCWLMLRAGKVKGAVLSNSFAFGGSNASVVLAREEA